MRTKKIFLPVAVIAAFAMPAAPALAEDPATAGYEESGGVLGEVMQGGQSPSQQPPAQQPAGDESLVLGERESGGSNGSGNAPDTSGNEVLGETQSGNNAPAADEAPASASAPAAANAVRSGDSGGELPFTGYDAAIVLILGLALVATGLALRRVQAQS